MKKGLKILNTVLLVLLSFHSYSQWEEAAVIAGVTLPPVALVDIEPADNSVYFSILPPTSPGMTAEVVRSEDKPLYINYTSALARPDAARLIVAGISGGSLPEGIELLVEASEYSGNGRGRFGIPAGRVSLSENPKTIITDVGNCFTGDGEGNGHLLNMSVRISDISKINSATEITFSVVYTICDN